LRILPKSPRPGRPPGCTRGVSDRAPRAKSLHISADHAEGGSLEAAADRALDIEQTFDPSDALSTLVAERLVVRLDRPAGEAAR